MQCENQSLILRPDRLGERRENDECRNPVLQLILWLILARHGYEYDKKIEFDSEARKKWHGLRRCAIP
jgi:hypothetical protein